VIEVRGAEQFAQLSKRLRDAANKDLQKEMSLSISRAMRPLTAAIRASAASTLPQSGGLAARIAKSSMRTRRRAMGITLIASNPYTLQKLDDGSVRHPVYGHRNVWVTQSVTPGWWTRPTTAFAPQARQAVQKALDDVAAKI
jgi:hypothetical protein